MPKGNYCWYKGYFFFCITVWHQVVLPLTKLGSFSKSTGECKGVLVNALI